VELTLILRLVLHVVGIGFAVLGVSLAGVATTLAQENQGVCSEQQFATPSTIAPGQQVTVKLAMRCTPAEGQSEMVTIGITGLPKGSTFSPKQIPVNTDDETITITTSANSLPGKYTAPISGTSASCPGGYGNFCNAQFVVSGKAKPPPTISCAPSSPVCNSNQGLYWFGEINVSTPPERYHTVLEAAPDGGTNYTWKITAGSDFAQFENGQSSIVTNNKKGEGYSVEVFPKGDPGNTSQNVIVTVSIDGGPPSAGFLLRVLKPYKIMSVGQSDISDGGNYYQSRLDYVIVDQTGEILPQEVKLSETSSGSLSVIKDADPVSAPWKEEVEQIKWEGHQVVSIYMFGPSERSVPPATHPCKPTGCQNKVVHWCKGHRAEYFDVESVQVASFVRQYYTDHGRFCNLVSPPASDIVGKDLPVCPPPGATMCPSN